MSSFLQYLESKKAPKVIVSLDHYRETVTREIYDQLLSRNREFISSHLEDITFLQKYLGFYPKKDEILLAVATQNPVKIKKAHEQFQEWTIKNSVDGSFAESALYEIRAFFYGKEISFSKESAENIVLRVVEESFKNIQHIANLLEAGIQQIPWNDSAVFVKAVPTTNLVTDEAMVIVGQPPALTFMCKNSNPLEIFDVQETEDHPESTRNDYFALVSWLKKPNLLSFATKYAIGERKLLEGIKREIALGMEKVLPNNVILYDEIPKTSEDIWEIKFKNKIYTEEAPIRWLHLIKKAEK